MELLILINSAALNVSVKHGFDKMPIRKGVRKFSNITHEDRINVKKSITKGAYAELVEIGPEIIRVLLSFPHLLS